LPNANLDGATAICCAPAWIERAGAIIIRRRKRAQYLAKPEPVTILTYAGTLGRTCGGWVVLQFRTRTVEIAEARILILAAAAASSTDHTRTV
jgi:hypothetical protein